ncbi:MAG TPA: hypothetical protein VL500_03945 [Candidatus Eisenbacteria bacterium]|nr:hypothetical protein [Candidatus Eisenbacteria bacterium]
MPQAILIAGGAQRFAVTIDDFRRYLEQAGIGRKRIREYRSAYLDEGVLEARLSIAASERTRSPLVIAFCGHGGTHGWAFDDVRSFDYPRLADALAPGRRPVMVVNDCCHAMALAEAFEKRGLSKDRFSLIAAAEKDETTRGGLLPLVIDNWSQCKPNRFGPELRWGAKNDHLFFPVSIDTKTA